MTSSRELGRRHERLCKAKLEQAGWLVHLVPPTFKFNPSSDVWGMFDIIGVRHSRKPEKLFIQVTTSTTRGRLKKLREFKAKYLESKDIVQLWVHIKRKGWKIYDI